MVRAPIWVVAGALIAGCGAAEDEGPVICDEVVEVPDEALRALLLATVGRAPEGGRRRARARARRRW
jgi:hypothetical protein